MTTVESSTIKTLILLLLENLALMHRIVTNSSRKTSGEYGNFV